MVIIVNLERGIEMKAKLIGIGAAGNKAAIKAIDSGIFPLNDVRLMNTTDRDINHKYDDISIIFGNQRGGCGKERDLAKKLMITALKDGSIDMNSIVSNEDDVVIIVSSSEGGTGCGASTILAKYIDSVMGKNVHLFVFTGFEQDVRGLQNTLEYFKDLDESFTVEAISNKKFLDESKNKAEAEDKANEEFVKRIRVFLGQELRESDQNIDETDLYKLSTTSGFMDIEKHVLHNIKNVSDMSNVIREIFDYSKSLEYEKTAKRIGIILNVSERTKNIDPDLSTIFNYTGEAFEVYNHIQIANPGEDEYIAIIVAGLKLPIDELKAVYYAYTARTTNIDKSSDNFLDDIGGFEVMEEDSMFNLKSKKKKKSTETFFDELDEEYTEKSITKKTPSTQDSQSVHVVKSKLKTNNSSNPFKDEITIQ